MRISTGINFRENFGYRLSTFEYNIVLEQSACQTSVMSVIVVAHLIG